MEVTLSQILTAREDRAARQAMLNRRYGKTIVCFTMNIPGPVKISPLIRRGFFRGCGELEYRLSSDKLLYKEVREAPAGYEAWYVLDMDPLAVKRITAGIEDNFGIGRLFDMDVIDPSLTKLDREAVGGKDRGCIVCGAPGRGCASRRIHSVEQLQSAVRNLLVKHFSASDAQKIGDLAVQSLVYEVEVTPKPGLVDRRNCGSHRDMDITTFRRSAFALADYFRNCVRIGMDTRMDVPAETFRQLRLAGIQAEQVMLKVTEGVNTHKGALFTLGILCGAAGRLWNPEGIWSETDLFRVVSAMTREAMEADFHKGGQTNGQKFYALYGIRGIRGQVAQGLPAVAETGLPVFCRCLDSGMDENAAGVRTLLTLISRVEDTNMIARGGLDGAEAGARRAEELLNAGYTTADVEALDDWFIARNLSPGGCADLLSAVYFVHRLTECSE